MFQNVLVFCVVRTAFASSVLEPVALLSFHNFNNQKVGKQLNYRNICLLYQSTSYINKCKCQIRQTVSNLSTHRFCLTRSGSLELGQVFPGRGTEHSKGRSFLSTLRSWCRLKNWITAILTGYERNQRVVGGIWCNSENHWVTESSCKSKELPAWMQPHEESGFLYFCHSLFSSFES